MGSKKSKINRGGAYDPNAGLYNQNGFYPGNGSYFQQQQPFYPPAQSLVLPPPQQQLALPPPAFGPQFGAGAQFGAGPQFGAQPIQVHRHRRVRGPRVIDEPPIPLNY